MSSQTPIPITPAIAENYRQEALSLRRAAEIVGDPRLAEQLSFIADQYDAAAASIEVDHQPHRGPHRRRDLAQEAAD